jgi:hypothetical protein
MARPENVDSGGSGTLARKGDRRLDDLLPELAGKPVAFTPGGFVLVRLPKGCLAIFTREDYLAAVGRGRAVLRSRTLHRRLEAEQARLRA